MIVNKLLFDIRQPHRGEVVVFHVPQEGRDFIKRVIALPGDTVRVQGDDVFVNDKKQDEPYLKAAIETAAKNGELWNETGPNFPNEFVTEGTVPADSFLAMGDNRSNSEDSRRIGFIPYKQLIGRADVIFWPPADMKIIKHG